MLDNSLSLHNKNRIWSVLKKLIGQKRYEMFRASRMLKYKPDLQNPRTFNEKVIARKLYHPPKDANILSDKFCVRGFVEQKLGKGYLPELYFYTDDVNEITEENLPEKCVIKTNHGSGGNFIIKNKQDHDFALIRKKLAQYLKEDFGYLTNEQWYSEIKPTIIVEELLSCDGTKEDILDYKFYCFDGKPVLVQIDIGRYSDHIRDFYDMDWVKQDLEKDYPSGGNVPKPQNLDEIIEVVKKLSDGYDFVRVDLYNINGKIIFGEMTFAPGAGWVRFSPVEWDRKLGDLWK